MVAVGQTPGYVIARMMVDTGAQRTLVDDRLPAQLGFKPLRYEQMIGVSQKPELYPVYKMSIAIMMDAGHAGYVQVQFHADIVGMPTPGAAQQHNGLLGRDFLRQFKFVYDGPAGEFHLSGQGLPTAGRRK
jgi:hypothetical protein